MADNAVADLLERNRGKNFVSRMFDPKSPRLDVGDGRIATHKMAWAEMDSGAIAFPTVVQREPGGSLVELPVDEAIQYALRTGEFIQFANPSEADDFAAGSWKMAIPANDFSARREAKRQKWAGLWDMVKSGAEVAVSMATSTVAEPFSGFAGLAEGARSGSLADPRTADAINFVRDRMTYAPKSQQGQEMMHGLGQVVEAVIQRFGIDNAAEVWESQIVPKLQEHAGLAVGSALAASGLGLLTVVADRFGPMPKGIPKRMVGAVGGKKPPDPGPLKWTEPKMDHAKASRARDMGFWENMQLYHGTSDDFPEFSLSRGGQVSGNQGIGSLGVSVALSPDLADKFARRAAQQARKSRPSAGQGRSKASQDVSSVGPNVMPLIHRAEKPGTIVLRGDESGPAIQATVEQAWKNGHDAILFRNYTAKGVDGPRDFILVRNPNQLRSNWAAFDPSKKESANLLAGIGGMSVLTIYGPDQEPED